MQPQSPTNSTTDTAPKPVYVIDGANFTNFDGFIEECNRGFIRETSGGGECGGNLDAFNDYLYWGPYNGGRRTPYVIVWRNSAKSRRELGHRALLRWLAERLREFDVGSEAYTDFHARLRVARQREGINLFDWLAELFTDKPHIELRLE